MARWWNYGGCGLEALALIKPAMHIGSHVKKSGISVANAIFYHKEDSQYYDVPAQHYHFPKQYLSRVQQTIGYLIVYYGPIPGRKGQFYTSVAQVVGIRPDTEMKDHFYADVKNFLNFDSEIDKNENGGFERSLFSKNGSVNGGRAVQAVRIIPVHEFAAIYRRGLSR